MSSAFTQWVCDVMTLEAGFIADFPFFFVLIMVIMDQHKFL